MLKSIVFLLCMSTLWVNAAKVPSKIQSRSKGERIVGGTVANAAQFPFAASIYHQTNGGTYFCTGSLFNHQFIITAGQCVADAILFTIRLGSNSLTANEPNAMRVATDTYFLHPDFDPIGLDNDVGLIKLRLPVVFTDYIRPISVLNSNPLPDGSRVLTFGWGQTHDQEAGIVDRLNFVFLVTLTNEECKLTYGSQITDNMVCVEGNFNEGTCNGDLGSPLIQYGGSSLTYLVGISSFISRNGCETSEPSGFIRIDPYAVWVNDIITSNQ